MYLRITEKPSKVTDRQTDGRTDDLLWHKRVLRSIAQ